MKIFMTIFIFCSLFNIYAEGKDNQLDVGSYAGSQEIGKFIKQKLPNGWTCSYDYSKIIIKRNKSVTIANIVSRPLGKGLEQFVKENGIDVSYLMTLHFVPKLNKEQFESLLLFKKKQLSKVSPNDFMNKYEETNQVYRQFLIPQYFNSRYSIYFYKTDDCSYVKVFPKSVEEETKLVLRIIESILKKYPNH